MADPYKPAQGPPPAYQPQPQQGAYQQPPPAGYAPQQPGYAPQQPGYAAGQQSTVIVSQPQQVVVTGGCPACGIGHLNENFTALGICLAICFFPLGVLCCFLMMEKRCSHCGATF